MPSGLSKYGNNSSGLPTQTYLGLLYESLGESTTKLVWNARTYDLYALSITLKSILFWLMSLWNTIPLIWWRETTGSSYVLTRCRTLYGADTHIEKQRYLQLKDTPLQLHA